MRALTCLYGSRGGAGGTKPEPGNPLQETLSEALNSSATVILSANDWFKGRTCIEAKPPTVVGGSFSHLPEFRNRLQPHAYPLASKSSLPAPLPLPLLSRVPLPPCHCACHCERSAAISSAPEMSSRQPNCPVVSLHAMTNWARVRHTGHPLLTQLAHPYQKSPTPSLDNSEHTFLYWMRHVKIRSQPEV